jgi:hypothetical protein
LQRKYTLKKILNELLAFGFDEYTFFEAYSLLANDDKELELFLGLPPKSRMGWIIKRFPKRKNLKSEEQIPFKRRRINVL